MEILASYIVRVFIFTIGVNNLIVAQRCWVEGEWSVCSTIEDCPTAISSIWERKKIPPLCRIQRDRPIICCPIDTGNRFGTEDPINEEALTNSPMDFNQTTTTIVPELFKPEVIPNRGRSISREKCKEYSKSVFLTLPPRWPGDAQKKTVDTCFTRRNRRIVGGVHARPREFPHLALVGFGSLSLEWLCGGSLISERYVLTSGHCCKQTHLGSPTWVRLGELDLATTADNAEPMDVKVVSCITHPEWDPTSLYNDMALLELENDVKFNSHVRPACLHVEHEIENSAVVAAGWGRISYGLTFSGGEFPTHLLKVKLEIYDNHVCNNSYHSNISVYGRIPEGILPSQLCAGNLYGKDTCQGDATLQQLLTEPYCMHDLVGILSFGKVCGGGHPAVHSRVSHFVPWIESIVWPNETLKI